MVDTVLAGVSLEAGWIGSPPRSGDLVDVELDIDAVLQWGQEIAMAGAEATLDKGPRLRGTVGRQDQELLTLRIAHGLLQVQVDAGPADVPPGTAVVVVAKHLKLYPTGV
ncbi:hypothetical protein AB0I61_26390 [Polymorphospora rubra]|uniref:hypothetical protein n=1 Tax=Polymorphospora rubra TaxID=338584 RepID=UPI0033F0FD1B